MTSWEKEPPPQQLIGPIKFSRVEKLEFGSLGGKECIICKDPLETSTYRELGRNKGCRHLMHYECLDRWVQSYPSCPLCKTKIDKIIKYDSDGKGIQIPVEYTQRATEEELIDVALCGICKHKKDDDLLLICDNCLKGYHTYCIGLDGVPDGYWCCKNCEEIKKDLRQEFEEEMIANTQSSRSEGISQERDFHHTVKVYLQQLLERKGEKQEPELGIFGIDKLLNIWEGQE